MAERIPARERRLLRKVGRAIADHAMIGAGDRVLVALSGGKDSWTLLHCLEALRQRAPVSFTLEAVTVHPGFPGFDPTPVAALCRERGLTHRVLPAPIREIVAGKLTPGTSACSFCARLRRGALYGLARREGFTRVALGHHADDLIETLLLCQLFTGEIKSMPPRLEADDGYNVLIRPLALVFEADIERFATAQGFPLVDCACPGAAQPDRKRVQVKALLRSLEEEHPGIKASLLSSLGRVRPRYLMDRTLHVPPPPPGKATR